MKNQKLRSLFQISAHVLSLLPLIWLILIYFINHLGPNPIQYLERRSGDYALILLLASLACTPLQVMTGEIQFKLLRKPLGLYAFAYAGLHLLIFLWLDYGWVWTAIWQVFVGRPYLWSGLAAFMLLMLLAGTSTRGWQRRLKKNWQRLHWLVYLAGILVVIHFALGIKGNLLLLSGEFGSPLAALIVLTILLLIRTKPMRSLFSHLRGKIGLH